MALQSDRPLELKYVPEDPSQMRALIDRHWAALKRLETLRQTASPQVLDFLVGFRRKKMARIEEPGNSEIFSR